MKLLRLVLFPLIMPIMFVGCYVAPMRGAVRSFRRSLHSVGIVGGGFAGLAVANQLKNDCSDITMYDIVCPGEAGASSAAGGLLHPFAGGGKFIWKGVESYEATTEVLENLQKGPGKNLFEYSCILKPVFKEEELEQWKTFAARNPEQATLVSASDYSKALHMTDFGSQSNVLVSVKLLRAAVVHPSRYLCALWESVVQACPNAKWIQLRTPLSTLDEISSRHDVVVIAAGVGSPFLAPQVKWNVNYIRGRSIVIHDPAESTRKYPPILAGQYFVQRSSGSESSSTETFLGATHEHFVVPTNPLEMLQPPFTYADSSNGVACVDGESIPNQSLVHETAQWLASRVHGMLPDHVMSDLHAPRHPDHWTSNSGVRLVTARCRAGRVPIVGRLPSMHTLGSKSASVWTLTGLGSRGLLYHTRMAQYLASAISLDSEREIPAELLPSAHCEFQS